MSQRPPASRPESRSPSDSQRIILPPLQVRDDTQQAARQLEMVPEPDVRGGQPSQLPQQSPRHAPPSQTQSGEDWRLGGPPRDLGVHSILNPTEPEVPTSSSHQVGSNPADSPIPSVSAASQFRTSPPTVPTRALPGLQQTTVPSTGESYSATFPRRRILTPRSPRATSRGRRAAPGTIDAQRSPFLPSRGRPYTAEPGPSASAEVPPMPTPPAQTQQQYGFPPAASTTSVGRRSSISALQGPGRTPLSQSASPSMSASSRDPSSQTSPATFSYPGGSAALPGSYFPGQSFASSMQQGGGVQFQGQPAAPEGPYSASQTGALHASSSGSRQTSASDPIQVLTFTTSQGLYHVPVDVHHASRLADEKRARNAGASARFRQRRKEKEKEASTNIERLQQQTRDLERKVREVEQERDFYRGERDRFRDAAFRTPGMQNAAMQGPPSPMMRAGALTGQLGQMGGPPQMGHLPPETAPDRPPRRRRTDTQREFTSLPYTLLPASTLPPVQAPGYPGPGQGPPSLPPLRIDNTAIPQTTAPSIAPATAAGPLPQYDPYARSPYERGWPSEGGRR